MIMVTGTTLLYQTELNFFSFFFLKKKKKRKKRTSHENEPSFLVFFLMRKDVISILIMWSDLNKQWLKNIWKVCLQIIQIKQ